MLFFITIISIFVSYQFIILLLIIYLKEKRLFYITHHVKKVLFELDIHLLLINHQMLIFSYFLTFLFSSWYS